MQRLLLLLLYFSLFMTCKTESSAPEVDMQVVSAIDSLELKPAPILEKTQVRAGWIEIMADDSTKLDLRYATDNNFVDEQMYECGKCFIREEAYAALRSIRTVLKAKGYGIILYDCYRPKPVQQKLWNKVPNASYVTPPSRGSMHNRGVALDLGLIDKAGNILDMGTEFDYFGREGHHDYYNHPKEVLDNRKLLKSTMEQYNFASIRTEWWHYSYVIGEYEIADWQWDCQ